LDQRLPNDVEAALEAAVAELAGAADGAGALAWLGPLPPEKAADPEPPREKLAACELLGPRDISAPPPPAA